MRLIDADKLLTKEHQYYNYLANEWFVPVRDIEDAPAIEERKKGNWIKREGRRSCSECKKFFPFPMKYCPHCGADMREKEENDG